MNQKILKRTLYLLLSIGFISVLAYFSELLPSSHKAVKNYLMNNQELLSEFGQIKSIKVRKSTFYQGGAGSNGKPNPAYNLFQCVIYGRSAKADITVRETDIEKTTGRGVFSVEEITIYQ